MRSALKIVAFAQGSQSSGIVALLRTALDAMDDAGHAEAAMHVAHALSLVERERHRLSDESRPEHMARRKLN